MRGGGGGGGHALLATAILVSALLACLAPPSQCRPQPPKAAGGGYPNSLAGADEGKVTLIFCVIQPYFCMPPSARYHCIRTDKYYKTDEECKANCGPACNPRCPPQTSLMNVSSSIPS